VDKDRFKDITKTVIDKLEGGYWNPAWHGVPKGFETSGETLFGIDRLRGDSTKVASGQQFWKIVDANKSPNVWKHNYIPNDPIKSQLIDLASDIQYNDYNNWSNLWLTPKAKQIVESDPRLIFNFSYATWNGPGWFKKFSSDINKAVDSGITDTDKLTQIAIDSRTNEGLKTGSKPNSLIAQGGKKIASFIDSLKEATAESVKAVEKGVVETEKTAQRNPMITIAIVAGATLAFIIILRTIKRNRK